jgi:hypothetical protein
MRTIEFLLDLGSAAMAVLKPMIVAGVIGGIVLTAFMLYSRLDSNDCGHDAGKPYTNLVWCQ